MAITQTALHLARHADSAWCAALRPWLEAGRGRLARAYVIVATRGQAQGLKQRCLVEGVPLLGVEFLTPGLARKKWVALQPSPRPAMGRELLLLGLRTLIARRLEQAGSDGPDWGFWKSLASDPERALDDFDELLKAGFRAADFPLPALRSIFLELADWVDATGYTLAATEAERAGIGPIQGEDATIGGRVLVYGLGPELWGEFFNVTAFVRRCADVTAVLPEPEFRGEAGLDERWIELWSEFLGAEALPLDVLEPAATCEAVGALWQREGREAGPARLLVGRTRGDEMQLIAGEAARLLARGAANIAVIFPRADAAHLQLARLLSARGVPFTDVLETKGPPPVDVQAQRALLEYHGSGGRLEELLALWPLLRAIGATTLSLADARRACERSFDTRQTHNVDAHLAVWDASAPEVARVVRQLGAPWPQEVTLQDALHEFRAACTRLQLEDPEGWKALDALAARDPSRRPLTIVVATLASFLAEASPVAQASRGRFARITLTTRRRAEGLAWSHVIFAESNAGVWPTRAEPSCWLTDEQRTGLNTRRGRQTLGLLTAEDRARLERSGLAALTRDTAAEVIFSAALFSEREPELRLAPNAWLERVMWAQGLAGADADLEGALERAAIMHAPPAPADLAGLAVWNEIWRGRRDGGRPFDDFFFAGDPARITPDKLPARLIERGVQDPAELWFEAVLRTRRVCWDPFVRARRKALGLRAHELLARALQPEVEAGRGFGEMLEQDVATRKLDAALAALRGQWPADHYWDSFHAELRQISEALLGNVYDLPAGRFVATEAWLPAAAHLELGPHRLPVVGRLDLVRLDQPEWRGARVDIIDFKTGGDLELSAERMARSGASLQLGVYLAAARSLGIRGGAVWMIKPEPGAVVQLDYTEMGAALKKLAWLEQALTRGIYGARTRDRSEYAPEGCAWPLACTPVRQSILEEKFALTFGVDAEEAVDE
ncbi:MAG TPA: PD-(D/E)XK nuclease family protein [Opitutaceae bacterium]|nr:PD-(D/E)XK nuclease family protein [Opitutaceae bacterium]